jgi:hypothetical protein
MTDEKRTNVVDGTYYGNETPTAVVRILEESRRTGLRLRLHYGDTKTGRDWMDEWGMTGRISRSMGPIKIPILISSNRALGGGGILDHCIVRIRTAAGNRELYRHPLYNRPTYTTAQGSNVPQSPGRVPADAAKYPFAVLEDGAVIARFETAAKRSNWFKKMDIPEPQATAA